MLDNDLEEAINQISLIKNNKVFFEQWIEEAKYYIEVNKTLNYILN